MKAALLRIPRPLGLAEDRIMGGGGWTEEDVGKVAGKDFLGMPMLCPAHEAAVHHWQASRGEPGKKEALIELLQKENSYLVCLWA